MHLQLEALTSAIPKGGSSGKKQKTSHEASYSAHGAFDDGGKRVEDKGKEPLSEEEEKELSQSIQSELISLDDGEMLLSF
jgi:hypothetical protein